VDDPLAVRVVERRPHALDDLKRALGPDRSASQLLGERRPLHVLLDDEHALVVGGRVEDGHEVRVVERGPEARLSLEAPPHVLGRVRVQALDRHAPAQPLVLGQVDRARAAAPEPAQHAVAAREQRGHVHAHTRLPALALACRNGAAR
jgi:hypothetical protein